MFENVCVCRLSLASLSPGKRNLLKEKKGRDRDLTWLMRGGPNRDLNTVMEIQLTKVSVTCSKHLDAGSSPFKLVVIH